MHVLITGAAGMIGRKLTQKLARDGGLNGKQIDKLTLLDVAPPHYAPGFAGRMEVVDADLSEEGKAARAIEGRPDFIFHLAGVVSGEAELDFDKGYRVNLDGTRALLEAVRAAGDGYRPRIVYTSSIAVFGAPFPPSIPDDFHLTPLTSYGTQKAIGEALLADYTRRGFCDGVGIRLPSIVVRPGKPNKAASGFFSGIIREPLAGEEAVLPVAETVVHTHATPRAAIGFLMHAAGLRPRRARAPRQSGHAGRALARSPSRSPRCAASPASGWRAASAASTTHWSRASSRAGRSGSRPAARASSASRPRARSTRSCASTSTKSWAESS